MMAALFHKIKLTNITELTSKSWIAQAKGITTF